MSPDSQCSVLQRTKLCPQCGVQFSPRCPGNFKRQKFCSMRCSKLAITYTPEQRAEAFWRKVDKSAGPEACWPWLGAVTAKHGYGNFQVGKGKVQGAHKFAWIATNGPVPDGMCVLHRCDNRICCNTAHHFLGTKKDNALDKMLKERDPQALFTHAQVREIRSLFGTMKQADIARKFKVNSGAISKIKKGENYAYVK